MKTLTSAGAEHDALAIRARRVIRTQLLITVLIAVLFLTLQGSGIAALSALFGGGISIVIAWFLSRGVQRATQMAARNPKKSMATLYVGAVQRFLLVLGLLVVGIAGLKLEPIALCVGFAVAQLSYLIGARQPGSQR